VTDGFSMVICEQEAIKASQFLNVSLDELAGVETTKKDN
jgi:hypothetical protein